VLCSRFPDRILPIWSSFNTIGPVARCLATTSTGSKKPEVKGKSVAAEQPAPTPQPILVNYEGINASIHTVNNRNPRSGELTGLKPKKLGLETLPTSKAYYHRCGLCGHVR
jgi:hypothetical protein